jgi:hypothetical protein
MTPAVNQKLHYVHSLDLGTNLDKAAKLVGGVGKSFKSQGVKSRSIRHHIYA